MKRNGCLTGCARNSLLATRHSPRATDAAIFQRGFMKRTMAMIAVVALLATGVSIVHVGAQADKRPAKPQKGETKTSAAAPAPSPGPDRMTPATFSGLELRPIGPAVTSGRVVDFAV